MQQYAKDDYNRYLDALDQWNADRNFNYSVYMDEQNRLADQAAQEQKELVNIAETLAAYGDFSGYKALGYTDDQIVALTSGYNAQLAAKNSSKSSGGSGSSGNSGSKMTLTTAKAMAGKGQFTDEVIETLKAAGFNDAYLEAEYGYEVPGPDMSDVEYLIPDIQSRLMEQGYSASSLSTILEGMMSRGKITEDQAVKIAQHFGWN